MTYAFTPSTLLDITESLSVEVGFGSDAYEVTRKVLQLVPLARTSGARVLLKPNAGRMAAPASGIDTHPEVVAAAIDAFVLDQNSCSACQSTLLMFLERYGDNIFDYFGKQLPVNIAIGKGHETLDQGTLCLGNCTIEHRNVGPFVPGCPPVVSSIHNVLTRGTAKGD